MIGCSRPTSGCLRCSCYFYWLITLSLHCPHDCPSEKFHGSRRLALRWTSFCGSFPTEHPKVYCLTARRECATRFRWQYFSWVFRIIFRIIFPDHFTGSLFRVIFPDHFPDHFSRIISPDHFPGNNDSFSRGKIIHFRGKMNL